MKKTLNIIISFFNFLFQKFDYPIYIMLYLLSTFFIISALIYIDM